MDLPINLLNFELILQSFLFTTSEATIQSILTFFVTIIGLIQVLKGLWAFFNFLSSSIRKQGMIKGDRYVYHFTRFENEIKFREIKLDFKRNILNQLIVKSKDEKLQLTYKGIVTREENQLLFQLK
jgi:hypothetical protein